MRRKVNAGDMMILAVLAAVSALMLYPLVNVLAVSASSANGYIKHPLMIWPHELDLTAYRWVVTHHLILSSYRNTVVITLLGTVISMFLTATLAFPLSCTDLKGRKWLMTLIVFTMFFNGGMIPNYYLVRSLGMIDSLWALMVPGAMSVYNMILMKSSFEGMPESLKESAYIDGASDLTIFLRFVLPLSLPIIATLTLFYAVGKWNSYFNAILYIRDRAHWTLQLVLRELVTQSQTLLNDSTDIASLPAQSIKYAVIVVAVLPILCVYPFLQRFFVKGVMVGSVKG
ncbi:putative ABC transporter permease protein YtcP [Clostridia bacterium]|nr:putative ABC transporter permease protein YtcP [Clostridia bacterium]